MTMSIGGINKILLILAKNGRNPTARFIILHKLPKNELVLVEESKMINEPHHEYFPDFHWSNVWTIYEKSFSEDRVKLLTIWVNPQKNTVLFRYVSG